MNASVNKYARCAGVLAALLTVCGCAVWRGGGDVQRPAELEDLPRGISAWIYHYDSDVIDYVAEFNAEAEPHLRFRYLFPYAGSLGFNAITRRAKLFYDPKRVAAYAESLPKDVLIMPIVDARADKNEFSGWTEAQYLRAAQKVAEAVGNDDNAAGVQIDVEPFRPDHIPFYSHVRSELRKRGKFTTMFVGNKDEELLTRISEACDIVVLSGYDVNGQGTPLEKYSRSVRGGVARLQKVSAITGRRFMVGIPAAASWGEYEYVVEKGGKDRRDTGVKQEEYVGAAIDVLKNYKESEQFIGAALWHLSIGQTDEPEKAEKRTKYPNYIKPSVWEMLKNY